MARIARVAQCACARHTADVTAARRAVSVDPVVKTRNLLRLRRIEGQVRALAEMVDSGRPCEDIAQQMSAARKAMEKAFYRMMACSMMEAVSNGNSIEGVERSTRILEKYA